jgi:CO/xanthine dehydrogenase Mo-binding subunit
MTALHEHEFSRKSFLKGGGAMVVGFSMLGGLTPAGASAAKTPNVPPDATLVDSWLAINADNTVTMYPPKMEFGQGTWTGFRQIVAEELDVSVNKIFIPLWDTGSANPFPNAPTSSTVASNGTAQGGPALRQAAAEARRQLLTLAAVQLGVPVGSLAVADGVVSGGGRSVRYSELLGDKLFKSTIGLGANAAPLKSPSQYKVVGTRVPRFDLPEIVTGAKTYVQNVRIPGMIHGRVVRPRGQANMFAQAPEGGPASFTVLSVDESSIKHIAGAQVVRKGNFVGVVAPTEYAAIQAAAQLRVKWSQSDTLPASGNQYGALRASTLRSATILNYGNVDNALKSAAKVVTATYEFPFQMHGPLGPICAICDVRSDGATVFAPGQDGWGVRTGVAQVTGLPVNSIRSIYYEGASTFNSTPNFPVAVDAAIMSQLVAKPVRVQYMRWDNHGWEPFGPNNVADVRGGLDADGKLIAYDYVSWLSVSANAPNPGATQTGIPVPADGTTGSSTRGAPERMPGITSPNNASGGGRFESFSTGDQYFPNIPNRRITGNTVPSTFYHCQLRAPEVIQAAWGSESMIDELAHAANMDSYLFRRAQTTHSGWLGVLDTVAKAANWQPRVSASKLSNERVVTGRGIAIAGENHANDDVYAGVVAEVEVDRKTGKIVVTHLYGAQDSGVVVNPASAENQISGMLTRGVSRTLVEEVTFSKQRVTSIDWIGYPTLRFKEHPKVTTIQLSHMDEVVDVAGSQTGYVGPRYRGVGESIEAPVPAAIGNAVFDATGVRLRQIPLTPAKVRAALAAAGRLYKA